MMIVACEIRTVLVHAIERKLDRLVRPLVAKRDVLPEGANVAGDEGAAEARDEVGTVGVVDGAVGHVQA